MRDTVGARLPTFTPEQMKVWTIVSPDATKVESRLPSVVHAGLFQYLTSLPFYSIILTAREGFH